MIFGGHGSIRLQLLANSDVQVAAGSIVRGDDESVFGRFDVALGDGADALFCVGNFLHTALLLECVERGGNLARGQQFDGRFQSRVLLANDLIESGCAHSGLLQLLERAARFDPLMLADVADQKHVVAGTKPRKELADLVRAGKARFIDKVQVLSLWYVWICSPGEKALQGSSLDSCLIQLARGAGGRGKTLDLIAM